MGRNLLFVSEYFWPRPAGGEVWSYHLCTALAAKGWNVTVITLQHDDSPKEQQHKGMTILRPYKAKKSRWGRKQRANKLAEYVEAHCEEHRPDVIHVMAFALNVAVSEMAAAHGIPCVTSVHSFFGSAWKKLTWYWPVMQHLEKRYLQQDISRVIHVPSGHIQKKLHDLGKESVVIHNWLPSKLPRAKPLPNGSLLFVGALEPVKNPMACLDVAGEQRLYMIGSGSLEGAIRRRAVEEKIRVHMLGDLPREETLRYIGGASLVLAPSVEESFSMVALEAVTQGTPVAGTPVGIIPELPGTSEWPPEEITEVSKAEQQAVRRKFTKARAVGQFTKLYDELIRKSSVVQ